MNITAQTEPQKEYGKYGEPWTKYEEWVLLNKTYEEALEELTGLERRTVKAFERKVESINKQRKANFIRANKVRNEKLELVNRRLTQARYLLENTPTQEMRLNTLILVDSLETERLHLLNEISTHKLELLHVESSYEKKVRNKIYQAELEAEIFE